MKSFLFPILLALAAFAFLGGASPAEPEDPVPEDFQKFVQTEVTLSEDEEPDMDEGDEEEQDRTALGAMPGSENRIFPRLWCRLKCARICIANPNATCVCTKTFLGIFPLFTIRLTCC
eukprot:maker-scaffold57_size444674-snap-gene-3.28 protein:Tk04370 transcript:maker-scaffold57_size444674-snap-gene-3.28-mRNA-1 annotation:"multispecies: abc transporter"